MKKSIPVHSHDDLSGNGVHLKIVTSDDVDRHPVEYAHRDDYYIFGIIVRGSLCCDIDFMNRTIREGELQFIRPGQVHRFIGGDNFEGWMLMVDSSVVTDRYRLVFEEASICGASAKISPAELDELKALFSLMNGLVVREVEYAIVRNLVTAFIGIVAGCFKRICHQNPNYNSRHTEIFLQFNSLLQIHVADSHSPSFYADKLHLSPVYLNEAVRNVSGLSVSGCIRNEIVLRAKRLLYHTNQSVKEIAATLGFADSAYFTRMFTKTTGKSPLAFRQNLELSNK